jgi:hypothetical protein
VAAQEAKTKAKEKREAEGKASKPKVRSFTDEDLKKYKSSDGAKAPEGATPDASGPRPSPYGESSDAAGSDEGAWRRQAEEARRPVKEAEERVKGLETEMGDLREQLNPMSTRYVLGGNSTAGPGQVYEIEEKLRGLEAALTEAKAALAEAEKSWQQFVDEARGQGASPAWLEP